MARTAAEYKIRVDSHSIEISNPGKILFPENKIAKSELAEYYLRIGRVMVPHVRGRPVTMHRYPNGLFGEGFIQKDAPDYYPDWIKKGNVKKKGGGIIDHVLCENTATLVYLANQACITLHVWLSRIESPERPDRLIFDLDPPGDEFEAARFAAREFRALLDGELGLPTYLMTTGSRGLHVVVPLDGRLDFDDVRKLARAIAGILTARHPDKLTSEVRKAKRNGRLFIDIARNAYGQTAVAPYSVRARHGAPIATPLNWEELDDRKLTSDKYTIKNIFKRIKDVGDPWASIEKEQASLAEASNMLKSLKRK